MGYYTRFQVKTSGSGDSYKRFLEDGYQEIFGEYDISIERLENDDYDQMKWYDHEDDMKEFSAKWPNVLFTLTGEGEEPGDLWVKYFRNGKVQTATAKITYEPLDESLLPVDETLEEKARAERIQILNEVIEKSEKELAFARAELLELVRA